MFHEQHHRQDVSGLYSIESGPETEILVVLIHGSLDRSGGMALIARHIHLTHRVMRYDRRGYARSWPHDGPFTIEHQVNDLVELIGSRQVILIGHSYGGNVALSAAARLGDQVVGVSTYETPLSWMSWWPGTTAGAMAVASNPSEAAQNFMVRLIGEKRWNSLPERTREERRREGPALLGELTALRESPPWEVDEVRCSVLCGYGSRGMTHHADGARWLATHLSSGDLVELEGAAHGAPMTHAELFVSSLVMPHLEG